MQDEDLGLLRPTLAGRLPIELGGNALGDLAESDEGVLILTIVGVGEGFGDYGTILPK